MWSSGLLILLRPVLDVVSLGSYLACRVNAATQETRGLIAGATAHWAPQRPNLGLTWIRGSGEGTQIDTKCHQMSS